MNRPEYAVVDGRPGNALPPVIDRPRVRSPGGDADGSLMNAVRAHGPTPGSVRPPRYAG